MHGWYKSMMGEGGGVVCVGERWSSCLCWGEVV